MGRKKSSPILDPIDLQQIYGYRAEDFIDNYLETLKKVQEQFGEVLRPNGQTTREGYPCFAIDDEQRGTFYKEYGPGIHLRREHLLLDEFQFMVIVSLLSLPHGYFRGSTERLLTYMGFVKVNKKIEQKLIDALKVLQKKKYIIVEIEEGKKSSYNIFVKQYINVSDGDLWLSFHAAWEIRFFITISPIHQRSYFKLLKVWVSMQNQPYGEKFGYFEIQRDTGLTKNQVIHMVRVLKQRSILENIVKVGSAFKRKADGSVLQLEQKL